MATKQSFRTNPEKQHALELWTQNPTLEVAQIAGLTGVAVRTIQRWRRDPEFVNELVKVSRASLHSNLPALYYVAVEKAMGGDYRFMKIILDHVEKLEELQREVNAEHNFTISWRNVNAIIG